MACFDLLYQKRIWGGKVCNGVQQNIILDEVKELLFLKRTILIARTNNKLIYD